MGNAQLITRVGNNSAGLSRDAIDDLNREYRELDFEARIRRVYQDFAPDKIMVTSSFAATSAYFLHIISSIRPEQKIHFIDRLPLRGNPEVQGIPDRALQPGRHRPARRRAPAPDHPGRTDVAH